MPDLGLSLGDTLQQYINCELWNATDRVIAWYLRHNISNSLGNDASRVLYVMRTHLRDTIHERLGASNARIR